MTLTLELPQELERELAQEAAQQGLSLTDYVLHVLATDRPVPIAPTTGVELVQYWQSEGLIGSRSDIDDSQTHARQIREQAEQRLKG